MKDFNYSEVISLSYAEMNNRVVEIIEKREKTIIMRDLERDILCAILRYESFNELREGCVYIIDFLFVHCYLKEYKGKLKVEKTQPVFYICYLAEDVESYRFKNECLSRVKMENIEDLSRIKVESNENEK